MKTGFRQEKVDMELYKELLIHLLQSEKLQIVFPDLKIDVAELVELHCYQTLQKIKSVLEDDTLDDSECFFKIEEIVRIFEETGSGCGSRHDFG